MKNREIILNWLKRARSSLERARIGKMSQGILYEDLRKEQGTVLCFFSYPSRSNLDF